MRAKLVTACGCEKMIDVEDGAQHIVVPMYYGTATLGDNFHVMTRTFVFWGIERPYQLSPNDYYYSDHTEIHIFKEIIEKATPVKKEDLNIDEVRREAIVLLEELERMNNAK